MSSAEKSLDERFTSNTVKTWSTQESNFHQRTFTRRTPELERWKRMTRGSCRKDSYSEYHLVVQSNKEREQQLNNKYPNFVVVIIDNEILMEEVLTMNKIINSTMIFWQVGVTLMIRVRNAKIHVVETVLVFLRLQLSTQQILSCHKSYDDSTSKTVMKYRDYTRHNALRTLRTSWWQKICIFRIISDVFEGN